MPVYFCMHDKNCVIIRSTIKKLLQFEHSKLGQILHVDKTCFLRPGHIINTFTLRLNSLVFTMVKIHH